MDFRQRTTPGHIDSITVIKSPEGWEVTETHDATTVRTQRFTDWHRVERAVQVFEWQTAAPGLPHSTNR